jgi:microcystin degradation protein MlrC
MEDAEGDWIAAARAVVGPDCPIAASYDLHGNVSERVIDALDMFAAYRTAPHIDVDETKARACAMLVDAIRTSVRPFLTWARIPVILQGERTSTVDEPAASLYARLAEIDARPGIREASLMVGYAWADEPRCTACAVLTGTDAETMQTAAAELAQAYWAARDDFAFGPVTDTIEACLDEATRAMTRPVIVADSGDNPTAGGVGDRAELLAELLRRGFDDALVAGIADPPATDACYAAGVGATVPLRIGASLDPAGSAPVQASAEILFLLPADIAAERQAVVRIGGVTVVLTGRRRPFHEIADFARLGLDPAAVRLLVVKSGYLAPALAAIANPNLMALSAGVVPQDLTTLPVRHIPRPTFPWDREFGYSPKVQLSARRPQ